MFIADDVAYRKLVLYEDVKIPEVLNETVVKNITNIPEINNAIAKVKLPQIDFKKYYSLKTLKIALYSLFILIGILVLKRMVRLPKKKDEPKN